MGLLSLASFATDIASTQAGAKQAKRQAFADAALAQQNAEIAQQRAQDAAAEGRAAEQRQRMENSQKVGQLRAQIGSSGVDLGGESATGSIASQAALGEADALSVRSSYQRQVNSYLQSAGNALASAQASQQSAANTSENLGYSLLGKATSVNKKWYGQ